ncbi:MAG: hypothetical protein K8U03_22955 [Planctomycetia bacterium]|nr:hypothetical protein [Planctomycetia bacterium]
MKPKEPELDRFGFPIPPGFDEAGPRDPNAPPPNTGRRIRFVLRMAVVAALLALIWNHYDLGRVIRDGFGRHLGEEALKLYFNNDLSGALATADRAVAWSPENAELLLIRGELKRLTKDYRGSLADAEQAAILNPSDPNAQSLRRQMYFYLHEHHKAAAAATESLAKGFGERAILLNDRAYARALGDFELDEALVDIDEALRLSTNDNSSLIDTRGYVLFRQKKYPAAIDDLNRAIGLTEKIHKELEAAIAGRVLRGKLSKDYGAQIKSIEQNLAVMYHHRGEVYEKQGKADEAKRDFATADQFGFNPEEGVY